MNGQDLEILQKKIQREMEESKETAKEKEIESAEYTKQYEIKLSQRMVILRESGTLGSMVKDVAKGDEEIAELKFQSKVADAVASAARENIQIKKRVFDSIEATKKRELG